jgi:glyoxylase-like metal-dependent hydrolase (beta-lactamase superfamily II)
MMSHTLLSLLIATSPKISWASNVHVEVFSAEAANVNSFVIYDSVGCLIVDTTRNSKEALQVANLAKTHGSPHIIFVTYGHPDHFLGLGALKKEFPNAQILVASQDIKNDIIGFAELAEKNHWIEDEPSMKPKSSAHPDGFDYKNEIQVLSGNQLELPGGESIEVLSHFPPTEASHTKQCYSQKISILFSLRISPIMAFISGWAEGWTHWLSKTGKPNSVL